MPPPSTQQPEPLPDPSVVYATPEELAADEGLSLEERAALLERWVQDDEALVRAEGEGMAGGERPQLPRVARMLALVRERLAAEGRPSPPPEAEPPPRRGA